MRTWLWRVMVSEELFCATMVFLYIIWLLLVCRVTEIQVLQELFTVHLKM